MVAAALLQPAAERAEEVLRLDVFDGLAEFRRERRRLRVRILPQQEVAQVMDHLMRQLFFRRGLFEPREQRRQQVEFFEVMENLAAREKFFLHHRHAGLDELRTAARQDGSVPREAERLLEKRCHGEPVGDAADERGLGAEQEALGKAVAGRIQMRRKREDEDRKRREERLVGAVPVFPEERHSVTSFPRARQAGRAPCRQASRRWRR